MGCKIRAEVICSATEGSSKIDMSVEIYCGASQISYQDERENPD